MNFTVLYIAHVHDLNLGLVFVRQKPREEEEEDEVGEEEEEDEVGEEEEKVKKEILRRKL